MSESQNIEWKQSWRDEYLKAAISYHKETRVETYPFARDAVREGVYNALIHCNWADNIPIQIQIEEKVMYISNSCLLPFDWTPQMLMESHASRPFNPDIARVFYCAGYIENWDRGIQKICDACAELGAPQPEYIVHGEDIMLKFTALESALTDQPKVPKRQNGALDDALDDTLEDEIFNALRDNPKITQVELAAQLNLSRRTIQRALDDLKKKGFIERAGGKQYGCWRINSISDNAGEDLP